MRQVMSIVLLLAAMSSPAAAQDRPEPRQTRSSADPVYELMVWNNGVYRLNRYTGAVDEMRTQDGIIEWIACKFEEPPTAPHSGPPSSYQLVVTQVNNRPFLLFDTTTGKTWMAHLEPRSDSLQRPTYETVWRPLSSRLLSRLSGRQPDRP